MLNVGMPLRPLTLRDVGEQYMSFCGDFVNTATSSCMGQETNIMLRNDVTAAKCALWDKLKFTKHQCITGIFKCG